MYAMCDQEKPVGKKVTSHFLFVDDVGHLQLDCSIHLQITKKYETWFVAADKLAKLRRKYVSAAQKPNEKKSK